MRYEVRDYFNTYAVYDTELNLAVSFFDKVDKAQKEADKLNANPPKPGKDREWYMTRSAFNGSETILDNGWEPFSADAGFIYFRKAKK